jgi:hypothetical protein
MSLVLQLGGSGKGGLGTVDQCDVVIANYETGDFLKGAVESALRSLAVAHIYISLIMHRLI